MSITEKNYFTVIRLWRLRGDEERGKGVDRETGRGAWVGTRSLIS